MQYLKGVSTLKIDSDSCTGCGMCITVCPHEVFVLNCCKAEIKEKDNCMECGACALNCPFGAIKVKSGVGCAAGILNGIIYKKEPTCDCSNSSDKGCC